MDILALDVMGYHTGSKVAVALALLRPAQVRHVIMISAPVFTAEEHAAFRDLYGPDKQGAHLPDWGHGLLQVHAGELAVLVRDFCDSTESSG